MNIRGRALGAALLGVVLLAPWTVRAHPLAPSLLELRETADGRFAVRWKTPAAVPTGADVAPRLPEWCVRVGSETADDGPAFVDRRSVVDCGPRGLHGATIAVSDLAVSSTVALLRIELADGRVIRALLDGTRASFTVPEQESQRSIALGYLVLGGEHLLSGLDHLLFLLCLCLLVQQRRALLWTVTAFTAGHSVTLTLATLGVVHFPQTLAECGIALSIVLLAAELLRDEPDAPRTHRSWIVRRPWAMAFLFGLLHGLGFASALGALGLPSAEIPLALLAFNVGIEIAQAAFVVVLLLLARLLRPLLALLPPRSVRLPAYAIGALAAFWFWSRAGSLLGALLPS
jgi:hydrogenase/urease accessory protein HupE